MHALDLLAIAIYFVVLIGIGLSVARRERGIGESESFLAADRNMNLVQTTASTAATDIGGGFSIAMGGLGFTLGISGSWLIAISGLSVIMVSFLMVPKVKRWADRVKFLSGAIILAYTALGGLKAVIYTDVFQMVVLMIGIVFIAVPIGLWQVGGWSGIVAHFSSDPATASLVDWGAVGWRQAIGWFFSIFPVWFISIAAMQRIVAARDEMTARRAFFLTGVPIEWPLFAIGSTLIGMIARILLPDIADPELATPMIILELLPIGVAGIVIAAYIAAVMSTADSVLMGPVAIFTNDIYRKHLQPDASDASLVRVARIATLVFGTLGIGMAYLVPNVLDLILYAYTFGAAGLFFPMLALLFWPRATASGAFWSILCAGSAAVIWSAVGEPWGIAASWTGWLIGLPGTARTNVPTCFADAGQGVTTRCGTPPGCSCGVFP
jgi:SSS family solute:Na+ symporter